MLKKLFSKAVIWSGLLWLYKSVKLRTLTVLTYHRVSDSDGYFDDVISAKPKAFAEQMKYVHKHCTVIDFNDLKEMVDGKSLPKNAVIITFDDGYLDNYTNAYPVLKKYNLKATISLITGYLGGKGAWWDRVGYLKKDASKLISELKRLPDSQKERRLDKLLKGKLPNKRMFMNWAEIKKMSGLITYAAHTHNHPILTNVSFERAKEEIMESKRIIEKKGHKTNVFTYPNGTPEDMNLKIDNYLKNNFDFVLSTMYGPNKTGKNLFKLRRIGVEIDDDLDMFRIKLSGFGRFASMAYERFLK